MCIKKIEGLSEFRFTWARNSYLNSRHRLALNSIGSAIRPPSNLEPHFNICPTDTIDAVIEQGGARQLVPLRWGSVPWWNKPLKDASWLRDAALRGGRAEPGAAAGSADR